MAGFTPFRWEAEKRLPGADTRYLLRLADFVLAGGDGRAEASMFSYSYVRLPRDASRPVLFAYNGGPGAASGLLHMGLLGPRLVKFPGYPELEWPAKTRLEDNAEWLLDCCDIVLADPPGAGWARLLDEDAAGEYYSVGGDARAFARFIGAWLRENGREASPVYLLGESYGTIRSVALADCLPEDVRLAGIISVGTSLNVGSRGTLPVEPNVRRLGANAACCWFHHHRGELPLEDFVREAMDFAYGAYARALLLGSRLPEAEREDALDKLAYYTGVDRGFLAENRLRFGEPDFLLRCCPGRVLSVYDSRLTYAPAEGESYASNDMESADIFEPDTAKDGFMGCVCPAFDRALAEYAEGLETPGREYLDDSLEIGRRWNYRGYEKDTLALPAELMARMPRLRFMFVNGCYDLSSTFDFMDYYLSQYDLPAGRVERVTLPSGHASYVGEGMAEELNRRIRAFITREG